MTASRARATQPWAAEHPIRLQAGDAEAVIDPANGGNVRSVTFRGREILRQDQGETRVPVPRFGSVVLAPWVGEVHSGIVDFRGESVRLPANVGRHAVHGLVHSRQWTVVSADRDRASFVCSIEGAWSLGGSVRQDIQLDPNGITLMVTLEADRAAMPVSLGWHPWFQCQPDTSRLQIRSKAMLELADDLIPTGRVSAVLPDADLREGPLILDRRLDVVYLGVASPVELVQPDLHLSVAFDPAISIVVAYITDDAVCIEPWSAWPDAWRLSQLGFPSGVRVLEIGERLEHWTRWAWAHN